MKMLKQILCVILVLATLFALPMPTAFAAEYGYLPDGCYTLTSGLDDSKCLDVSGAGIDNGTNIQIWSANGSVAQMFYITRINSGWYSIRNIDSRKAVDVAGGDSRSGVNVQLYDWNGTDAQLWQFYNAGSGCYYIKNKLGYYLDVSGGQAQDGTNVQVYEGNATNAQKWKFTPSQGIYTFTSRLNNTTRLDVDSAGTANETNIQVWTANETLAQMFLVSKVPNSDWYSIRNVNSQKALDVAGGVSESGVNVQLYDWNGTDAQLWQFYDAGNGYYYVKNKLGYYLDVSGGQTGNGTNVQVYEGNATNAQMWKLELADLTPSLFKTILVNLQTDNVFFDEQHPINKLGFYYKYFNHNAKYDIKREGCWNNLFTDIAYPGFNGVILFNGWIITPEQLGNILYGLTGRLLGFSDKTIYQGGGFAASGSKYLNDASKYYGDSAMDHEFISIGIGLSSNTPTIDLDLGAVPSWILDLAKSIL